MLLALARFGARNAWWLLPVLLVLGYLAFGNREGIGQLAGVRVKRQVVVGPGEVDLGVAVLRVPEGSMFVGEPPSDALGPEGAVVGWLESRPQDAPQLTPSPQPGLALGQVWYARTGYVAVGSLDPGALLAALRSPALVDRERPVAPPGPTGFEPEPRWDVNRQTLLWGVRGENDRVILNLRVFTRDGFFSVIQETHSGGVAERIVAFDRFVGEVLWIKPGRRHGEAGPGDPRARFAMSDLVSGRNPVPDRYFGQKQGLSTLVTLITLVFLGASLPFYARMLLQAVRDPGEPSGPEPAYRHYFYGKWWRDYTATLAAAMGRLRHLAQTGADAGARFLMEQVVGAGGQVAPALSFALVLLLSVVLLPGLAIAGLLVLAFGLVHVLLAGLLCLGSLLAGTALWAFERLLLAHRAVRVTCPNRGCYRRVGLPHYLCPGCGALHRKLLPGSYGTLRRRCRCGERLPTLFLLGRNRLPSLCPECQRPMAVVLAKSLHLAVAGATSAGKSSFLAAVLMELCDRGLGVLPSPRDRVAVEEARMHFGSGSVLPKTAEFEPDAFLLELTSPSNRALYIYDAAGEAYETVDTLRRHEYLGYLHGILLVVDPFSVPVARAGVDLQGLQPAAEEPQPIYDRVIRMFRELAGTEVAQCPVAVVLTKADALPADLDPRQALLDWGQGNLVRDLEHSFHHVRYFRVSALGRRPDRSEKPFEPQGTLEPILWLLNACGLSLTQP
ncbi:MAG: hypothetical protein AB1758_29685 [Candidatus Eremiobacterota bacterium]